MRRQPEEVILVRRRRFRFRWTAGALVLAVAFLASAAGGASGSGAVAQNYFGKTSKGWNAQIDVHGNVLSPDGIEDNRGSWQHLSIPFTGNHIAYHRVLGHEERWVEVRREQGGRVLTGWVRYVSTFPGYRKHDSGKVSFRTRVWASSEGADWTGKTSDGRPLVMSVEYRGRSTLTSVGLPFTVGNLTRPLTCREPGGVASTSQVTVPQLAGVMLGGSFPTHADPDWPTHTGTQGWTRIAKPGRGTATTEDGLSVTATMVVSIAPKGSDLVATGTLKLQGTATGDAGSYPCTPVTTTFTLRPR
jgi:hypothetical protein